MNSNKVNTFLAFLLGVGLTWTILLGILDIRYTPDKHICSGISEKYEVNTALVAGVCFVQSGDTLQPFDEYFSLPR